ncbi:hypothetical protein KFK09_016074 [Dendrobium nobile]|uniref:Retrotransposon Copia-like N-terminal domain-containing protein n=1 Tax=Dendrobium nobile TaxID=94219 RepID=A0A8T3AYG7_DENNO|nr:hypothetical protein KFK09_016074 [Dendrobium nobile]
MATSSAPSPDASDATTTTRDSPVISSILKFVVSNLKSIVQIQLQPDNYPIWRAQISKVLRANGFESHMHPPSPLPPLLDRSDVSNFSNPAHSSWLLTDQNLAVAICSTISSPILPYAIHLDSTFEIWQTLETRFQSTNRSKVIQLKNALHHISLKNSTVTQYLSEIKSLVDQIPAAGSAVDTEDIVLYILNGLPPSYQSFKTSIRTMLSPISLDNLYALLLSEEVNIASDAARTISVDTNTALYSNRGSGRRSRGRSSTTLRPQHPLFAKFVINGVIRLLLAGTD